MCITLTYVDTHGMSSNRIVEPLRFEGGLLTGFDFGSSPALKALIAASRRAASGGAPSGAGRGLTRAGDLLSLGAGIASSIGSSICLMSPSFLTKS